VAKSGGGVKTEDGVEWAARRAAEIVEILLKKPEKSAMKTKA